MFNDERLTLEEAHLTFAKKINGRVWELLDKQERTSQEDEEMVYAAHASCYHWLHAGTEMNHQRGEWMIARVYTVLEMPEAALQHAQRCLELTDDFKELMQDFDFAFAFEGAARANALVGNTEAAHLYLHKAEEAGNKIQNDEDRKIFFDDLNSGKWFGIK